MNKNCIVVIPTYNERDNIARMIDEVLCLSSDFNLLIIDDGSPDNTAGIVKELIAQYPERLFIIERSGKLGLGTAYICGFKWALENKYQYIFEMDADFSHNPKDLLELYKECKDNGADLAIGSRYKSGVNVVNWPMGRVLMSYFASKYVRFITGMDINDATAGFKCYKNIVLSNIDLDNIRFKGYAFQIEMKFVTWKLGFVIHEVPIVFTERKLGVSKMSGGIFNEALWGVIRMKVNSWFKKYRRINELSNS